MYKYQCAVCDLKLNFDSKVKRETCPRCKGTFSLIDNEQPYLQIALDELDSTPKVIYKGEEVELKQEVIFHWETETDSPGGTTIEIEYVDPDNKYLKSKRIEERIKEHIRI